MLKTSIHTFNDLDKWLSDNMYFESGHILSIKLDPLEIVLGYTVKGNYRANTERYILPFKLIPTKIFEWIFNKEAVIIGEDNYIVGIEPINLEKGIGLELSSSDTFRLITDYFVIEELELIKSTFKPWVSDREIFMTANASEIPLPAFWKEELSKYGHNILFRYYSGNEIQPEQVPYPDYQGYYIQVADRIKSTNEGIFISNLEIENGKLSLNFENKDEGLNGVWDDLMLILSDFPNAIINSGNCEFTGQEWKQYLTDKILP